MEWIKNQPVFFSESAEECSDDEGSYPQLVDNTDSTQVQFLIEPCSSAQQLQTDPNFASQTTFVENDTWSISANQLCSSGNAGTGTSSSLQLDASKYYQINITVDSINVGGSIRVSLGSEVIGYITSTGNYSFYGSPTAFFGNTGVLLNIEVAETEVCISELTVYEVLTNAIIAIYNSNGVYQNEISVANDPDSFMIAENTITATINWASLSISNGCYYLCLLDPCVNTNGQNYQASITNWTAASSWTYEGDVTFTGTAIELDTEVLNEGFFITQQDVFNSFNTEFCITINVTFVLAGGLKVYFGSTLVQTITTSGIHQVTGTPAGSFELKITNNAETTCTINNIAACAVSPDDYVCDQTSNTFKLADYTNKCTLIINACNNENGLGFVFDGSGFTPRIRLEAKLKNAKYGSERNVYENSIGTKRNFYFSRRKQKNLAIDLQPEYVHDFLSLLLGFDNVYIDNQPYFVEDDEYNVEYSEASDNVGKVNILVSEKTQNVKNINCSDTESVCNLPPNYLLQADNLSEYILLTNGEQILING